MTGKEKIYEFVQSDGQAGIPEYRIRKPEAPNYRLHILLFGLTFMTTTIAGVNLAGFSRFTSLFQLISHPQYLLKGLPFSLSLMFILMMHEMGHYVTSRIHRVKATLPYFIPAPNVINMIGTFGAFIKMKSPIYDKRALLDIGAAGPVCGFIVSIPTLIIGLKLSHIAPALPTGGFNIQIGSSLIVHIFAQLFTPPVPAGFYLDLHPVAFAGWIGMFVTSLNLIPIGQLDGGHVAYAVMGEKYHAMTNMILMFLVLMGIFFWKGWLMWAIIIFFLGKKHPPSLNPYLELDKPRKILAWIVLGIFFLTFIPVPFRIS